MREDRHVGFAVYGALRCETKRQSSKAAKIEGNTDLTAYVFFILHMHPSVMLERGERGTQQSYPTKPLPLDLSRTHPRPQ